jgi:hypothetical protein
MSIIQNPNKVISIPDFNSITQSIKTINRAVPAIENGVYSYFTDSIKLASTIANNLTNQMTDALTSLPTTLENLKLVEGFASNIEKINNAVKTGEIDEKMADIGRNQLQAKLNDAASLIILKFDQYGDELSESAQRLAKYSDRIEVRLIDASATETANQARAKADFDRESARLTTLETSLSELNKAVDEKRGGPAEDLLALIPDEKALSSLIDVGAADAAAPEVAAAKKTIELAVSEIKKVLEVVDKTIEFVQLANIRDEIFKATQAQREVLNAVVKRLKDTKNTIAELDYINTTGEAMATAATEVNKMVLTFSKFVNDIQNLDGKQITAALISGLYDSMNSYLDLVRKSQNNVILT